MNRSRLPDLSRPGFAYLPGDMASARAMAALILDPARREEGIECLAGVYALFRMRNEGVSNSRTARRGHKTRRARA